MVSGRWPKASAALAQAASIRTKLVALVLAGVVTAAASAAPGGRVPGASSFKTCGAAGAYWPTMTLAVDATAVWVACKEQSRVIRVDPKTGRMEASVRLDGPVIAVALGYGSLWAVDSGATLYRVRPATARVAKRIQLGAAAAYNVWAGGGSIWVADDQAAQVIRVAPATGKVVRRIPVGDGPSSMAFSSASAWVISHRDRRLHRIELATNAVKTLATIPGDAPERIARLGGSLWITGRGTDLIRVDPQTGDVRATIEVGAGGIDLVAADGALWVPVRSALVDPTGFPTMEALRRVDASTGRVTTATTASGRVDVHGLRAFDGSVWLADNRAGIVYRVGT